MLLGTLWLASHQGCITQIAVCARQQYMGHQLFTHAPCLRLACKVLRIAGVPHL